MSVDGHKHQQHERVNVRMKVRISTIDSERDQGTGRRFFRTAQATCANVSRGGAFVLTTDPVAPGRRVLVEIEIPDGTQVQAIGRVAWSKVAVGPTGTLDESGIGVEFVGNSADQIQPLQDYLVRSARGKRIMGAAKPGPETARSRSA